MKIYFNRNTDKMFMVGDREKNFENDRSLVSKDGEYIFKLCLTPMASYIADNLKNISSGIVNHNRG